MTDKKKLTEIIAEIERLKDIAVFQLDNCKVDRSAWSQQVEVCKKLLSFIGSMPDERPEPISPADVGFEALGRFWDKEARKDSDELTHSVTKTSDQEPEEYKGILGEQLKYIDNEIQRLEKLKEESVSEDLLDEIHNRWEDDPHIKWPKCPYKDFKNIACHFANWQKQQIMKGFPTWKKSEKLIEGALLDRGILYIPRYMIKLSELKKLPKEG